ncbi:MAG: hypothetical protein LCH76_08105 [Actinobacteria bacterium]|nr:hypothetical protein [Actinomycetota bacterium]
MLYPLSYGGLAAWASATVAKIEGARRTPSAAEMTAYRAAGAPPERDSGTVRGGDQ